MSDQSQGQGWWQASDGKWYPPHLHPDYVAPAPAPPPGPPQGPPLGQRPQPTLMRSPAELKGEAAAAKARAKAMRPWYKKKRFILPGVLIVIIAIAAAAGGSSDSGKKHGGDSTVAGSSDGTSEPILGVGQTGTTSGFEVTLVTVEDPFTDMGSDGITSSPAGPGKKYIGVELSIKNTTSERQTMSSILGLEIEDQTGQRFDPTILLTNERPTLDGEIQPGGLLRGWETFEVPATGTLHLRVRGSVTAGGVVFDVT